MKKLILLLLTLGQTLIAQSQDSNSMAETDYQVAVEYYDNQNFSKALEWFKKAASLEHAQAQFNLGVMYENGDGVAKDYNQALEWYNKAADNGNNEAMFRIGAIYFMTQDYTNALEWYHNAANEGNANAQCALGIMYNFGYGVDQDYVTALKWFNKSAAKDNADALWFLGNLYENGNGVNKDHAKAVKWYKKAAKQGHKKAILLIANLQKKDTNPQKNVAQTTKPKQEVKQVVKREKAAIDMVDSDIPNVSRTSKNTFAIIIANEDYQEETKVDYAMNDGEVFTNYCYKTLGIPEKNVHFVANATLAKLIKELDWLQQVCKNYKGETSVIFYYAGHGLPDEVTGSANLLPTDGSSRLQRTCFSLAELYETLESLPAKKVTVLMDACFSGAKRNGGMLASARGLAIQAKASMPKGNLIVLSAAQGDETAYKFDEAKHGLFTYFLLKKLKDTKGNVTIGELSRYIQDNVVKYSIVENGKSQTPSIQISDNLREGWESLRLD